MTTASRELPTVDVVVVVERLVLLTGTLAFALAGGRVGTNLLVVLLESSQVLAGLGELTLLHTLTDIPVDEGTLGVHEVELVVKTSPGLSDGSGVAQHADSALDLGQITTWNDGGWLVVDTDLETSWAPVDELDGALGLDGGNGSVDVLGDDVTAVQHAAGHVLAVAGVALDHLVGWLEASVGDLSNRQLLVVGLLGRDDWRIRSQGEVDTWVWHQVGLELCQIDVQGTIETEGGSDRGHDLSDQAVEVGVGWALDVQVTAANIVQSLVVDHEGTVGVLQGGVASQDGVVWLNNSGGDLGSWVDGELELGLLAVVDRQTLHQEGCEAGARTTTEGVEDEEALETSALVSKLADAVKDEVNNLLANGVVTTGVVVGGILLAGDELLWVEELAVGTSADLIDHGWLEIDIDGTGNVLAGTSLREEGVEGVVTASNGLVGWHLAVGLNAMLEAVELPASVTDLGAGLSNVD